MRPHVKVYIEYFGYSKIGDDYIPCEGCGAKSVDCHHLQPRSLGGGNDIENLCCVCRTCHDRAHTFPSYNEYLKIKHLKKLNDHERD